MIQKQFICPCQKENGDNAAICVFGKVGSGRSRMTVVIVGWVSWFCRLVHAELVMSAGDGVLP